MDLLEQYKSLKEHPFFPFWNGNRQHIISYPHIVGLDGQHKLLYNITCIKPSSTFRRSFLGSWISYHTSPVKYIEYLVHIHSEGVFLKPKNFQKHGIIMPGDSRYHNNKECKIEKDIESLGKKLLTKKVLEQLKEEPYWKRFTKKTREWWR